MANETFIFVEQALEALQLWSQRSQRGRHSRNQRMSCLQAAESVLIHSVRGQPGNPVVDADSLRGPERGAADSNRNASRPWPKAER